MHLTVARSYSLINGWPFQLYAFFSLFFLDVYSRLVSFYQAKLRRSVTGINYELMETAVKESLKENQGDVGKK